MEEERLIELLAGYGYQSKQLEEGIREGINNGYKNFIAHHRTDFGDETMYFKFYFKMDWQFNAHRLKQMEATHHYPINIDTKSVAGIDIPYLENSLKSIDWEQYPFNEFEQGKIKDNNILNILDRLEIIRKSGKEGRQVADLLYVKHLPEDYCGSERLLELSDNYINTHTFKDGKGKLPGVNLAYHIVSGKLDRLYDKLNAAGFDEFADIYRILEKQFQNAPDNFRLDFTINKPEGRSILSCPVLYENGEYKAGEYRLTYTPYPAIEHNNYFGVDTFELEQQMKHYNWNNDLQNDPVSRDITEKLGVLRQSPESDYIADILTLKYWSGYPYWGYLIIPEIKKILEQLASFNDSFPISVGPDLALNLLQGKPVAGELLYPDALNIPEWIRLDLNNRDKTGHYPEIGIDGLSEGRMMELLLLLNYDKKDDIFAPVYAMRRGNTADIIISEKTYHLEAIPEQGTFRLSDSYYKEIPFNFSLSPEWTPQFPEPKATVEPLKENEKHPFQKKKTGLKKGKAL